MCERFPKVDILATMKTVGKKTDTFCVIERKEYYSCETCPIYKGNKNMNTGKS